MKRGQAAIEYMAVIGFVSFAVVLLVTVSYFYQRDVTNQVTLNQVDHLAKEIIDAAESVYFLGEPSKTTIKANIPDKVESITISNKSLTFRIKIGQGPTDISYMSSVNLTGSIDTFEGRHTITLETKCTTLLGCYVNITG